MRGFVPCAAVLLALASPSCQKGEEREPPTAYQRDVDRLCHAEEHSGALDHEPARRSLLVAKWLADNLETDEARGILRSLSSAAPAEKAEILDRAAREAGLSGCPLADAWKGGERADD